MAKPDRVTVEMGPLRIRYDVPPGVKDCPLGGTAVTRLLAYTLERSLRDLDTPWSHQIAAHMHDIRDMISAMPERRGLGN